MPDETGTEKTRSDAPGVDDSLFGAAADGTAAAVPDEQVSAEETEQDGQGPDDPQANGAGGETAEEPDGSDAQDKTEEEPDGLKVVVSIKGARATIGVQRPSADPHIETFDDADLTALAQEVPAVTERARARWEESPKHPAYERPAPPAKRRNNRRQQGAAQGETTETQEAETQQQTLRLF